MRGRWQAGRAVKTGWILLLMIVLTLMGCDRPPRAGTMVLNDFEVSGDLARIAWRCRTTFSLSEGMRSHGHSGLLLTLYPDPYPGLALLLTPSQQRWQGYRRLALEVFNPGGEPMTLHYRIDDRKAPDFADRANGDFFLQPGLNRLTLDLSRVRTSGTHRPLDWDEIHALIFFLADPAQPVALGIDHIRLDMAEDGLVESLAPRN